MSVNIYETQTTEPAGYMRVTKTLERVVKVDQAPEGAQVTTDKPYDWREKEVK